MIRRRIALLTAALEAETMADWELLDCQAEWRWLELRAHAPRHRRLCGFAGAMNQIYEDAYARRFGRRYARPGDAVPPVAA